MGRRRAGPPLRTALLELRPDGHGRQPLGDPARASGHRPAEDPLQQLLLPRKRRRVPDRDRARRRRYQPARQCGRPVGCDADEPCGRVQRPRRTGAPARAKRRRGRAHGAGAHQHRHRAAGGRLSRRSSRAHPQVRNAAHQRRDPHLLRRAGRVHQSLGPGSRHADHRQGNRWRHTCRRLWHV